jgi:hypothetical protein
VALDSAVFPGVAGTTDTDLWLEFTSDQPVLAYATIIHNVSGDPFAVMATSDMPPNSVHGGSSGSYSISENGIWTATVSGGVPMILSVARPAEGSADFRIVPRP